MSGLVPAGAKHPTVLHLRRLYGRRSARSAAGEVLIEGARALGEALEDGCVPTAVLVADRAADDPEVVGVAALAAEAGAVVLLVPDRALAAVASTVSPQPLVAAVRWTALAEVPDTDAPVLVLAGVADPGNAGALLRVGEAAGVGAVVFADGSVDPANPKVVRAAAGSLFRVPVVVSGPSDVLIGSLQAAGRRCLGLAGRGGEAYDRVAAAGRVAVVVGSEAHGLPPETAASLDGLVTVPMAGRVESLNAAVAAGVVCFELARRRGG